MSFEEARKKIHAAIRKIPRGRVSSYGRIAALAGYPRGARLTARALRDAPADVPWFRVLNAQGKIAMPAGSRGARLQQKKLAAEGVKFTRGKVDWQRHGWPRPDFSPLLD